MKLKDGIWRKELNKDEMNLPDLNRIEEKQEFLYIWEYLKNIFWLRCTNINK